MKIPFAALLLISFCFTLLSCDDQTVLDNRLEGTAWQLSQRITTKFVAIRPDSPVGNFEWVTSESTRELIANFEEDGTGTLIVETNGTMEDFEWESRELGESLQVQIRIDETKNFTVLIGERDRQLWEATSQIPLQTSTKIIIEKWELTRQ